MDKFIDNLDGIILSSSSQVYKGVIDGEYAVGVSYEDPVVQAIIDNEQITENEKAEAISAMTTMEEMAQKEAAAELLLEAKGYENCVVSIADGEADVGVNEASLDEAQRAQIEDIVKRKTDISGEHIVITPGAAQS